MFDTWISRRLAYVGFLSVILLVVGIAVGSNYNPGWGASGLETLHHYIKHHNSELASFYLFAGGLVVLVFFSVVLANSLHAITNHQHVLPLTVLSGGVLFLAGSAVGGYADVALITGSSRGLSPQTAQTMEVLNNTVAPIAFQIGGALIALGTGLAILLARQGWKWVGWISVVVGVGLFVNPFFLLSFLILVLLLSLVVTRMYGRAHAEV